MCALPDRKFGFRPLMDLSELIVEMSCLKSRFWVSLDPAQKNEIILLQFMVEMEFCSSYVKCK